MLLAVLSTYVSGEDHADEDDEGVAGPTAEPAGTSDDFEFESERKRETLTFDDALPLLKVASERCHLSPALRVRTARPLRGALPKRTPTPPKLQGSRTEPSRPRCE